MWSIVMRSVVMRSGVMRPVMYLFTVSAKVWLVAILICQNTTKKLNKIGSTLSDSQKWRFCKKKHQQRDLLKFQKAHPQNCVFFQEKDEPMSFKSLQTRKKKPLCLRHEATFSLPSDVNHMRAGAGWSGRGRSAPRSAGSCANASVFLRCQK